MGGSGSGLGVRVDVNEDTNSTKLMEVRTKNKRTYKRMQCTSKDENYIPVSINVGGITKALISMHCSTADLCLCFFTISLSRLLIFVNGKTNLSKFRIMSTNRCPNLYSMSFITCNDKSLVMRKPAFCIYEKPKVQ